MKFAKLVDKAWEDKTAAEILAAPPSALEGLTEKHDESGDVSRFCPACANTRDAKPKA